MSGGRFDYQDSSACENLFGVYPEYGIGTDKDYKWKVKDAEKADPMEDIVLSELVFDVFCLIHSLDWYKSGDTCEETYRKDVQAFKAKWFGRTRRAIDKIAVEKYLGVARRSIYRDLGITEEGDDE